MKDYNELLRIGSVALKIGVGDVVIAGNMFQGII